MPLTPYSKGRIPMECNRENSQLFEYWHSVHEDNKTALELSTRVLGRLALPGQLEFDLGEAAEFEDKE
jgi:hypothetical protein